MATLPTFEQGENKKRGELVLWFEEAGIEEITGGGLPSGLMTARSAIQTVCKQGRVPFLTRDAVAAEPLHKTA